MGHVISATTRFSRATRDRERFLFHAHVLLREARASSAAGDAELALESAYQAALRAAGAKISVSSAVAKRKRLPSSAWDRLALTGDSGAGWAATFSAYSRLRSRVASGIEQDPDPHVVDGLIRQVEDFLLAIDGSAGLGDAA